MNGVDITNPTRKLTTQEWNQLGVRGRAILFQAWDAVRSSSGGGRNNDRNRDGRGRGRNISATGSGQRVSDNSSNDATGTENPPATGSNVTSGRNGNAFGRGGRR